MSMNKYWFCTGVLFPLWLGMQNLENNMIKLLLSLLGPSLCLPLCSHLHTSTFIYQYYCYLQFSHVNLIFLSLAFVRAILLTWTNCSPVWLSPFLYRLSIISSFRASYFHVSLFLCHARPSFVPPQHYVPAC